MSKENSYACGYGLLRIPMHALHDPLQRAGARRAARGYELLAPLQCVDRNSQFDFSCFYYWKQ